MIMHYTVCLLICRQTNEVLLVKKDRTDFAGRYNGVGGKLEKGEFPEECAVREIKEETGADVKGRVRWLGSTDLPKDCATHGADGCALHFYTADVDKTEVSQQTGETEELKWFPIDEVLQTPVTSKQFAGYGQVQNYLALAILGYV